MTTPTTPTHPDAADWRPATADDLDALMVLVAAADRVDHPTWVTPREDVEETFTSSWIDPARDTILGVDAEGSILAAGVVDVHPSRDEHVHAYLSGRVHPDARGRGIGREVMRWEHERARQAIAEIAAPVPAAVFVYVEEADTTARRLAERRGLALERWFSTMVRDLADEVPEILPASDGIRLAAYDADRADDVRVARNDAFRDHWGSLQTPPERWAQFVDGPFLRPDLSWLALDGDRVVALSMGSVNEEDWAAQGYSSVYIDLLGVTRDRRGLRLAPAVLSASLRAARAAGLDKAVLDVDTESPTGALGLYERLGFAATERLMVLVERP